MKIESQVEEEIEERLMKLEDLSKLQWDSPGKFMNSNINQSTVIGAGTSGDGLESGYRQSELSSQDEVKLNVPNASLGSTFHSEPQNKTQTNVFPDENAKTNNQRYCDEERKAAMDQVCAAGPLSSSSSTVLSALSGRERPSHQRVFRHHSQSQITVGQEKDQCCQHQHVHHHHHHHHYHYHTLSSESHPVSLPSETRSEAKQFQVDAEVKDSGNDPKEFRQVINQILLQLSASSSPILNNIQSKPSKQERNLKHHRVFGEGVQSTPPSPRNSNLKRERPVRTSSAENASLEKSKVTPSNSHSITQAPHEDKTFCAGTPSTSKSKMSSRRSTAHTGIQVSSEVDSHQSGHLRSSNRHGQISSHRHPETIMHQQIVSGFEKSQPSQHFDMSQIQHSINLLASEQSESQKGSKSKMVPSNGSTSTKDPVDPRVKKERIKNLWGKVGKQGMLQAAAAKQPSVPPTTKWDQILNPLLQKQRQDRILLSGGPLASPFFNTTVGGEAGSGSGFFGQPGNATMECDCGDDSCPQCNLMLNMGSGY